MAEESVKIIIQSDHLLAVAAFVIDTDQVVLQGCRRGRVPALGAVRWIVYAVVQRCPIVEARLAAGHAAEERRGAGGAGAAVRVAADDGDAAVPRIQVFAMDFDRGLLVGVHDPGDVHVRAVRRDDRAHLSALRGITSLVKIQKQHLPPIGVELVLN